MEAHFQQRVMNQGVKVFSSASEKYLIQKFTKEIVMLWQNLELDDESRNNETMDLQVFKMVLLRLGFIDKKYLDKVNHEEQSENIPT